MYSLDAQSRGVLTVSPVQMISTSLPIKLDGDCAIVAQLEMQTKQLIESGQLRAGMRMPSVRQLAHDLGISTFTVVAAYDRLISANLLTSRRGSGYFVAEPKLDHLADPELLTGDAMDSVWLFAALRKQAGAIKAGAGVLPPEWFDDAGLKRCARAALRQSGTTFSEYPSPLGYRPLRDLLALKLIDLGIAAQADQILLTSGASHALDLTLRTILRRSDSVLIEEPGYYTLYAYLRKENIPFATVPRLQAGLDLEALERAVQEHRPKALFVNSILHNPTGSTLTTVNAHKILSIAERYDMLVIEDDLYGDFHEGRPLRLASLDSLSSVVYISSFSKTLAASLRIGFMAASAELVQRVAARKLLTHLATPEINERIVTEFLASGAYRRQLDRMRSRLSAARTRVLARLDSLGLEVPTVPEGGFFLWARAASGCCTRRLAAAAIDHGLILAPGSIFSPHETTSDWLRLNVAQCDSAKFEQRMAQSLAAASGS